MNERAKITAHHLSRQAIVYLRQSSAAQVENNRESADRQYALAQHGATPAWARCGHRQWEKRASEIVALN